MSGSVEVNTISNIRGRLKTGLAGFKRFSDDLFNGNSDLNNPLIQFTIKVV
ncbi:hypothetical protein HMPREF9418_0129 [Neisseria macacae ATCC 33926]|uniref:Uncharacterized protein n=1 Tax=Neisseria macacae ATCC 33926 TaxID=997348 RepID=A0AA36UN54_9NEIS|nr:hypothetical protein HMPREF9418_0129 [Neisseria macacae ATCC 33926]